jgi:uncharacterized protein YecE (DUF72 family)
MLAYYVERFHAVEINATFYRCRMRRRSRAGPGPPRRVHVRLKAPQRITHFAGPAASTAAALFLRRGRTLGVWAPALPAPAELQEGDRQQVLRSCRTDSRGLQFRHESWFDDEVYAFLRSRNVSLCIADTEDGATPAIATADFGYLRLRAVGTRR